MGTLTREKVLELRDQFIHLTEKTCIAAARLENYLSNTPVKHKDFAEVGPDLLSHVQGCLSDVYEAMDPEKQWESTGHSSLWNLCVRNDEFLTLAEVAIPTDKRNLIPPPEFPADFGHWPIRFNFQLVWESARFLTFTPGFVDEYLRKWQKGPRPASLSDHWGWDHRTGAIFDKPNWDILGKFHDMAELLGKLKVVHDSSGFSHGVEMRLRLREEFAAIAGVCPAGVPRVAEKFAVEEILLVEVIRKATVKVTWDYLEQSSGLARKTVQKYCGPESRLRTAGYIETVSGKGFMLLKEIPK